MAINPQYIAYTRNREVNASAPYAVKFAKFKLAVADAKTTGRDITIIEPWVIGETFEEITESLSVLAGTGVGLHITSSPKPWIN